MRARVVDAICPECGKETLEQRSGKHGSDGEDLFFICTNCGHKTNLYDPALEQVKKTREAKKKKRR